METALLRPFSKICVPLCNKEEIMTWAVTLYNSAAEAAGSLATWAGFGGVTNDTTGAPVNNTLPSKIDGTFHNHLSSLEDHAFNTGLEIGSTGVGAYREHLCSQFEIHGVLEELIFKTYKGTIIKELNLGTLSRRMNIGEDIGVLNRFGRIDYTQKAVTKEYCDYLKNLEVDQPIKLLGHIYVLYLTLLCDEGQKRGEIVKKKFETAKFYEFNHDTADGLKREFEKIPYHDSEVEEIKQEIQKAFEFQRRILDSCSYYA